MPRIILLLAFILAFGSLQPKRSSAQANDERRVATRAVYLELAGNGLVYTLNYDAMVSDHISLRLGGEALSGNGGILGMVNLLIGDVDAESRLEIGAGMMVPLFVSGSISAEPFPTATIGYRYQELGSGFFFKFAFTPLIWEREILPSGGTSFGYTF